MAGELYEPAAGAGLSAHHEPVGISCGVLLAADGAVRLIWEALWAFALEAYDRCITATWRQA